MTLESKTYHGSIERINIVLSMLGILSSFYSGDHTDKLIIILSKLKDVLNSGNFPVPKAPKSKQEQISPPNLISFEEALKRISVPKNKEDFPKVVISWGLPRTSSTAEAAAMSKSKKFIIFKQPIKSLRRGFVEKLNFDVGKDKTILLILTSDLSSGEGFFDPVEMCLKLGFPPTHIATYLRVREPQSNYASILRMDNTVTVHQFVDLKLQELDLFLQFLFKDVYVRDNWIVSPISVLSLDLLTDTNYSPEKVLSSILNQFFSDRLLGGGITGEFPTLEELDELTATGQLYMLEGERKKNPKYFEKIWQPVLEKQRYGPYSDTDLDYYLNDPDNKESFTFINDVLQVLHQEYTSLSADNLNKMKMK